MVLGLKAGVRLLDRQRNLWLGLDDRYLRLFRWRPEDLLLDLVRSLWFICSLLRHFLDRFLALLLNLFGLNHLRRCLDDLFVAFLGVNYLQLTLQDWLDIDISLRDELLDPLPLDECVSGFIGVDDLDQLLHFEHVPDELFEMRRR